MSKRTGLVIALGIGLLVLAPLGLRTGSLPSRISAQEVQPQAVPAQRGWTFKIWAEDAEIIVITVPGAGFTLYGSEQGDRPGGTVLDSGTTSTNADWVTLRASTAFPYYYVVVSSVPPGYWVAYNLPWDAYVFSSDAHWVGWDAPPQGTYYVYFGLSNQPTPTPTPSPTTTPTATKTSTATATKTSTQGFTATCTVTPSKTPTLGTGATRTATPTATPAGLAIEIAKGLMAQVPSTPLTVGDYVTFTLAVSNTGATPLSSLIVEDPYDQQCLTFVDAPGTPPLPGSDLRWEFPSLAAGDSRSWDVIFQLNAYSPTVGNCVSVLADGPQGQSVTDQACVEFDTAPPEPGLLVRKRVAEGHVPPCLGSTIHFIVEIHNTGGIPLQVVRVLEGYDVDCLYYDSAEPQPDTVDVATGLVSWNDIGPLAPGEAKLIDVYLLAEKECGWYGDCARAFWMANGVPALGAMDCMEVPLGEGHPLYLAVIMKQRRGTGPAPTVTATASPTATVTGPPGSTLIFADDFQDDDLVGWTPTGGQWSTWDDAMFVDLLDGLAWSMRPEWVANVSYEGMIQIFSGSAYAGAGLVIRSSADGTASYQVSLDFGEGAFRLSKRSPYQVLDSYQTEPESFGQWHEVKVIAVGNHIEGYLDGVKRVEATDNTYASGHLGVVGDSSAAKYDDLRAWSLP